MANDAVYVEGLTFFPPPDDAPDFVQGQLSVNLDELSEWLRNMVRDTDENGRLRFDIVEQKSHPGKFSIKLNTYKRQEAAPQPQPQEEDDGEKLPY